MGGGNFPGNQMQPRMMNRSMPMNLHGSPYSGANIQIKANAPNTIQYLPTRPTMGGNNARGPPNMEFLPRFNNPMNQMEANKMGGFYQNCNQMGGNNPRGPNLEFLQRINNPLNQMEGKMGGFYPNCNQIGPNTAGPQSNDMRMNPHMDRMMDGNMGPVRSGGQDGIGPIDGIGGNGMGIMSPHPGPNSSHPHIMMAGAQGPMMMRGMRPPLGPPILSNSDGSIAHIASGHAGMQEHYASMGGKGNRLMSGMPPDVSQPIPSQMSGPNNVNSNNGAANQQNFQTGQFMGPNSNEPMNEGYLKFQKELYATSTGNQLNAQQPGAPPPQHAMDNALNQNQQFFGNKKYP